MTTTREAFWALCLGLPCLLLTALVILGLIVMEEQDGPSR